MSSAIANSLISNLSTFDLSNIVFDKPYENTYGMRIPIKREYGLPLIIASPELKNDVPENWCFTTFKTFQKDKGASHSAFIVFSNQNGETSIEQKDWISNFKVKISGTIASYLLANKNLNKALKNLSITYFDDHFDHLSVPEEEKNEKNQKNHPTLALSLMEDRTGTRVYSTLYRYDVAHTENFNFEEMTFAETFEKRLRAKFELIVDSIYIQRNGHISLTLKLDQALLSEDKSRGKSGRKMFCSRPIPEEVEVEIGEE